jgi:hypothetical protein
MIDERPNSIPSATEAIDRRLLLLSEQDNVVVACARMTSGDVVRLEEVEVELRVDVPLGFKIARRDLEPGDKVLKYGAVIGSATMAIRRGDIVHLHNMKSDYLPTYAHETRFGFTKR